MKTQLPALIFPEEKRNGFQFREKIGQRSGCKTFCDWSNKGPKISGASFDLALQAMCSTGFSENLKDMTCSEPTVQHHLEASCRSGHSSTRVCWDLDKGLWGGGWGGDLGGMGQLGDSGGFSCRQPSSLCLLLPCLWTFFVEDFFCSFFGLFWQVAKRGRN